MLVLALDTASDRLLAGIANDREILGDFSGPPDRSHSERVIATLDSLLKNADIAPSELDALAVAVGPGSFTGLRVGIATVLGLAQAWHKPILTAGNMQLARLFFSGHDLDPVVVTHCRGEEFYLSKTGENVEILTSQTAIANYGNRLFGGYGAERLAALAEKNAKRITVAAPATWSGGDFALMVAREPKRFKTLDPANLDVNYVLKSQPEQKRDLVRESILVDDLKHEDLSDVIRIEREAFSDPWDEQNFAADIENDHVIALAARESNVCVGYLSCIALDDYGYVANVAVDGDFRSKGVGKALMDELSKRLVGRGIRDIVLDVRVSNSRAIAFYEKYGFGVITRRKGFYSTPPEDSFTMLKSLEE